MNLYSSFQGCFCREQVRLCVGSNSCGLPFRNCLPRQMTPTLCLFSCIFSTAVDCLSYSERWRRFRAFFTFVIENNKVHAFLFQLHSWAWYFDFTCKQTLQGYVTWSWTAWMCIFMLPTREATQSLDRFIKTLFWNFLILIDKQILEKVFSSNTAPSLSSRNHLFYKAEYIHGTELPE